MLPMLCPYLSKHEITGDTGTLGSQNNDGVGINSFHGLPGAWNMATAVAYQVWGELDKTGGDNSDTWDIDIHVPCFSGKCAQDWAAFVLSQNGQADPLAYQADPNLEHQQYGCDLWLETGGIYSSTSTPVNGFQP